MRPATVVHTVCSDAFDGVERYIVDTANVLAARGWAVSVIGGHPLAMRAHLANTIEYRPAATTHEMRRALRALGRRDIVHAHLPGAELAAARLKRKMRARLVVTRHVATPRGTTAKGGFAARVIEPRIDLQIAISSFVASATAAHCIVVHNGVMSSSLAAPRAKVVVVLQRLEPENDTATALRAWAASGLQQEGWRLVIYGSGSEEESLRGIVRARAIGESVTFAGLNPDRRAVLRSAEIMLATAVAEPFGPAVVEAMAEGTPVVATHSGAHPETLGHDAAYFAPGDVEACAAQLSRLARTPAARRALSDRARARQRQLFSIDAHVDRLERLYAEQLARRHAREAPRGR